MLILTYAYKLFLDYGRSLFHFVFLFYLMNPYKEVYPNRTLATYTLHQFTLGTEQANLKYIFNFQSTKFCIMIFLYTRFTSLTYSKSYAAHLYWTNYLHLLVDSAIIWV